MRRITLLVVGALALAACSADPEPDTAPLRSESPKPSKTAQQPASLTGSATLGDIATVTLSDVQRAVSGPYAAPAETPMATFVVKVTNKADKAMDPAGLFVDCAYGDDGSVSEQVFDDKIGTAPSVKILPGKSATWTVGCSLPEDENNLQVQVEHMRTGETAIFQGAVK